MILSLLDEKDLESVILLLETLEEEGIGTEMVVENAVGHEIETETGETETVGGTEGIGTKAEGVIEVAIVHTAHPHRHHRMDLMGRLQDKVPKIDCI